MKQRFSIQARAKILEEMATAELDLLVIGGGITGAGIALDASMRGLNVGLVEKSDFASGTSSRSTKLIHGGLRYLKQGEIKLVREVGRERAILYRNAPHIVTAAPMLLPIYKGGTYGYFASSLGLYLYDWLAGVERKERRRMLNREEAKQQEPLLRTEGLQGAGLYYEYRTDDARLTLDIMKTAVQHGAKVSNYAEVKSFLYRDGLVVGAVIEDRRSGRHYQLYAKQIVNAAGPWVDELRKRDGSLVGKRLFLTKGVHLVVAHERLPVKQAAYFDTPDGRMVFVIPRGRITYIGTTDTAYDLAIDAPRTTEEDRDYLLRAVNAMFPSVALTEADVLSHWAGLRPLIYEAGKGPSELSRKDEVFVSASGLITIAGGKLTGFRKMAEKVVDLVTANLSRTDGRSFPPCSTDRVVISGGERLGHASYEACKQELLTRGTDRGIDLSTVTEWIETYGSNTLEIYERYDALKRANDHRTEEELALRAQLLYSLEEEMTVTAADFLRLRTGWTYFHLQKAERMRDCVLALMGELADWEENEQHKQREEVEQLFRTIHHLPKSDQELREQQEQASGE